MSHLRHIIETKGALHAAERFFQVIRRFTFGRRRFKRMLLELESDFSDPFIPITFCVTASLLRRNSDLIRRLGDLGHRIASHSLYHTRMGYQKRAQQERSILESYHEFQRAGFEIDGFRSPYLNFNQDTIELLQTSPYQWTSQHMLYRSNSFNANTRRLFSIYKALPSEVMISLPRWNGALIEIPITLPDDEMAVERLRFRNPVQIEKAWLELASASHQEGELLQLLFHPERFGIVKKALLAIINQARDRSPKVWITTLSDLTKWWQARSRCQWQVLASEKNRREKVGLTALDQATVLIKDMNPDRAAAPIYLNYYPIRSQEKENGLTLFPAGLDRRFSIGVSSFAPPQLAGFLRQEGFWVEESTKPQAHAIFFDSDATFAESDSRKVLAKVDTCKNPLLRLWRWPRLHRSALAISCDVDSITLTDFLDRTRNF